jgi:hypothetical protein
VIPFVLLIAIFSLIGVSSWATGSNEFKCCYRALYFSQMLNTMIRNCFSSYVDRRKTMRWITEAAESELRHSMSITCECIALGTTSKQIRSEFVLSRRYMLEGVGAVEYD